MERYDVIIIGAGHNGLTAAAYLAKAGRSVLVLERADHVGGGAANREVFPGFTFPTAGYASPLLHESIVRDLELGRHGFAITPALGEVTLLPEGDHLAIFRDAHATRVELARHSQRDADAYGSFQAQLARFAHLLGPIGETVPPDFQARDPFDAPNFDKMRKRVVEDGERHLWDAIGFLGGDIYGYLDQWFETPALKAHLAGQALNGSTLGPMSATTASLLLKTRRDGHNKARPIVGYARGGIGAMSEALAKAVYENGGEIRLRTQVNDVAMKDKKAIGVVLERGDVIEASVVLSSLDLKRTFLTLFEWKSLPQEFLDRVARFKMRGASAKIHLALGGLPTFPGVPQAGPYRQGDWSLTTNILDLERAYDDWKNFVLPRKAHISFHIPTLFDPDLAPAGQHVMSIFAHYVPGEFLDGPWTEEKREQFANDVVGEIAQHSPDLESLVLHRETLTPPDIENEFWMTAGNLFHGETVLEQSFMNRPMAQYNRYATPVPNLFLCGSSAHTGEGMTGVAGGLAAREVLTSAKKWWRR